MSTYRPKFGPLLLQPRLHQQQAGFIQAALLFGIALMTAILGGFALANRSPTSQTDDEQAKVNASVVLKQGSDLRDGVARFASDNGATSVQNVATLDFSAVSPVGLFDAAARYASPQIMPTSTFATAQGTPTVPSTSTAGSVRAGHWFLNQQAVGNGIGTGSPDPMVVLPDLQLKVCQRINRLLYGSSTIPVSLNAKAVWVGDGTGGTTSMGAAAPPAGAAGWPEGCVEAGTSSGVYVYFKVVQEN